GIFRDLVALAGGHVIREEVAVVIPEEAVAVGRRTEIPANLRQGLFPRTGPDVDDIDVLVFPAVERAHELVRLGVRREGEPSRGGQVDLAKLVIGQADEFFLGQTVDAQVTDVLVRRFLELLLRLQALVGPVPDYQVRFVAGRGRWRADS